MRKILLVEPYYRNKYPPLGLMKIAAYHRLRGDYVEATKGFLKNLTPQLWDRIYVSSLFTFYWSETVQTIRYYQSSVRGSEDIWVGGVLATLLGEDLKKETGATVVRGLLDQPGILDDDSGLVVDDLIPDYSILSQIDYVYRTTNAYIGYSTRGCPKRCSYCAVHKIEPCFNHYKALVRQVKGIEELYGSQKDLLLLDNNVLASRDFERIINDIIDIGFHSGARFENKLRKVDFNQGLDACLLKPVKMKLLSRIALKPLRLALDSLGMIADYTKAVKLSCLHGVEEIGTYVLFNHKDTPKSFYTRLKHNIALNETISSKITSFPMKYIPLNAKDRTFISKNWNKRFIRGIQCILLPTRGVVSPNPSFFYAAFGHDYKEFIKIISMPEHYIIKRKHYQCNGAKLWEQRFGLLTKNQRNELYNILDHGKVYKETITRLSSLKLRNVLEHYLQEGLKAKE